MITQVQWLGLLLVTEANNPHEWPYVAHVVRNRVESARYPDTYYDVIRQRKQFSRFNDWEELNAEDCHQAGIEWALDHGYDEVDLDLAQQCSIYCATANKHWGRPFSSRVLYYYSPVSVIPKWSKPYWWEKDVARSFTPGGVDPARFVFGLAKRP